MKNMHTFNHWRRADKIRVFVPRSVAEVKAGKSDGRPHHSTDCGGGCSGGGCSGIGCGSSCGASCR